MKNRFYALLLFTFFSFFVVSCSSIFNGSKDRVKVNSTPNEARIFVNGLEVGKTPAILELKRGEKHIIEVKKEGFQTFHVETTKDITGWFWGNLLCGGVIGIIIDLATGNAYDVSPSTINATLDKTTGMVEQYQMEEFGSIQLFDREGNQIANVTVNWK